MPQKWLILLKGKHKLKFKKSAAVAASAAALALILSGCGGQNNTDDNADGTSGTVVIDGSSTVAPLSEAAADLFRDEAPGVNVTVATSGTGGGFARFCADETDISDASRPIKDEEAALCAENGIEFTELVVANDGLAVVVNIENDFIQCLTIPQIQKLWAPESEGVVMNWSDVDPSFPAEPISLYGAGTDSGTFDYFTEAINGETGAIRTDYSPSEDDNVLLQGISGSKYATGFFGLSYVEENKDKVKAVGVDSGAGCVEPSLATVQDGSYAPLGRPLFIYTNNQKYAENAAMQRFVDFYIANAQAVADLALFIGLTAEQIATAQASLATLK
jgi:phosphate transport system substrate-binding protein